jgi:hypothetical protein
VYNLDYTPTTLGHKVEEKIHLGVREQNGLNTTHCSRQLAHRLKQSCQPYAPDAFYPGEDPWYSFLLEAESNPGP